VYALDKKVVVDEISRLLKPGGMFVIIDGFFPKDLPLNSFLKNVYTMLLKKRSIPRIISLHEIQTHLKSAGFRGIIIHNLSKNISKHYLFGGFFSSMKGLLSAEVKLITNRLKGKTNEDADKIIGGAGFIEMLLGLTRNLGYYAIVATKE
jgi:hypothetical protein